MMSKNKQSTWLVTYLVIFILLHNTALITAHDAGYAKKHGMKVRYSSKTQVACNGREIVADHGCIRSGVLRVRRR
jgi:hypothetical protein